MYCRFCGDALSGTDGDRPAGYCTEDCAERAARPLARCRYCPELTRWGTCGWPSCERKAEAQLERETERAVQRDLARYQP
jgi:hypothetical protein